MRNTAPLQCVISGAQIGADIAGLRAAHACGIPTSGHMPRGYKTRNGALHLELVRTYNLQQHSSDKYPPRTETNVAQSTGTVRFAYNFDSPGEKCTLRFLKKWNRPFFDVPIWPKENGYTIGSDGIAVAHFIISNNIHTLNVAGNADVAIEQIVEEYLRFTFAYLEGRNAATEQDVLVR